MTCIPIINPKCNPLADAASDFLTAQLEKLTDLLGQAVARVLASHITTAIAEADLDNDPCELSA